MAKKLGAKTMANATIFTPGGQAQQAPPGQVHQSTGGQSTGSPHNPNTSTDGGDIIDGDYKRVD